MQEIKDGKYIMSFEFYDTTFEFYDTDSFQFYDTTDSGISDLVLGDHFLLPLNWGSKQIVRTVWSTNVQESINAKEIRSAIFSFYRTLLTYSYLAMDLKESSYMQRIIFKNLHNVWLIPRWMDTVFLSSSAFFGNSTLVVPSTENRNFEVGAFCILFLDMDSYEIVQIESMTETEIDIKDTLNNTWETGTKVIPLLKSRIGSKQSVDSVGRTSSLKIEFLETVDPFIIKSNSITLSYSTYLDYYVFNLKPNMQNKRKFEYDRASEISQFYGVSVSTTNQNEAGISFSNDFLFANKDEIQEFIDFFNYNKGRWGNFWIPSYEEDVQIIIPFSDSDTILFIEDINWNDYWGVNNTTGKYLNFKYADGTEIQREITEEAISGQLTLDSALGKACSSAELQFLTVSFLYFGRFDLDQVDMTYETDSIATTKASFKILREFVIE